VYLIAGRPFDHVVARKAHGRAFVQGEIAQLGIANVNSNSFSIPVFAMLA
jgi:hypothetical protein